MDKTTRHGAKVLVMKNGPYRVSGNLPLAKVVIGADSAGDSVKWEHGRNYPSAESYALCRCGHSGNKPFCDGTHEKIGFVGTETASRLPYSEQASVVRGPTMTLTDAESVCAFARFCDPNGSVWNLVNATDDPATKQAFVQQACACPSGRLVAWDNASGKPIEPHYEPSIALVEDPVKECSGPIWLRGGVQVAGADGVLYEVRNRVTLCRCGASQNKPFCDGMHAQIGFRDEG